MGASRHRSNVSGLMVFFPRAHASRGSAPAARLAISRATGGAQGSDEFMNVRARHRRDAREGDTAPPGQPAATVSGTGGGSGGAGSSDTADQGRRVQLDLSPRISGE